MQIITSRQNPLVVDTAKLQDKKYRRQSKRFFLEGEKLFAEALKSGVSLCYVMMTEAAYARLCPTENTYPFPVYCVSESVFEKISTEKSPQGVLSVAKDLDFLHKRYIIYSSDSQKRKFLLCGIQDPGNLGTMIRTANAFGIDELILSEDCADLYHPKTVRAAMGAIFRQKIAVCSDLPASIVALQNAGYCVLAATLNESSLPLNELCVHPTTCFAVGNEGHGLPSSVIDACNGSVIIPMQPDTESLNAAVAASLLMWEVSRQAL
jgi:TrmH family RNA methyltransferase